MTTNDDRRDLMHQDDQDRRSVATEDLARDGADLRQDAVDRGDGWTDEHPMGDDQGVRDEADGNWAPADADLALSRLDDDVAHSGDDSMGAEGIPRSRTSMDSDDRSAMDADGVVPDRDSGYDRDTMDADGVGDRGAIDADGEPRQWYSAEPGAESSAESSAEVDAEPSAEPAVAAGAIGATPGSGDELAPLLPEDEVERLRNRWRDLQIAFVDEPSRAVRDADALVDEVLRSLTAAVAATRQELQDTVETEGLRVGFRRYRLVFDQLVRS